MMLNNSTIVLIFVLLLIIYLFDNIKDLEDNLFNSPFVKKQSGKRKYFQEIELELPKPSKPINIESVKVKPQKDKTVKIKLVEVSNILTTVYNKSKIEDNDVLAIMRYYELTEELANVK